jgi:LysM repeat protein
LGRHSKPSRIRLPQVASTAAAAPTLASVVAAFFLAQQLPAATQAAEAATVPQSHTATLDAATQPELTSAQLVSATRQALLTTMQTQGTAAKTTAATSAAPTRYTVRPGDSLSAIAGREYHNADAWPVLYWANHHQIRWANEIEVGQVLKVPAKPGHIPAPPAQLAPPAAVSAHTVADVQPRHSSTARVRAQSAPAPAPATAVHHSDPAPSSAGSGGPWPGGAFGACVVERESGGNPQVMNSSGHYGLYQFSESTWVEYGGNPGDFGHASVAEQEHVFMNALARGGEFNWAPYDHC